MDIHKTGIICTKNKLWKHKSLLKHIIDEMIVRGYTFKELVRGEPSYFVFADQPDEIDKTLQMKGTYFGVRIKFQKDSTLISIHSNTNGIDNVKFEVYTESEDTMKLAMEEIEYIKSLIRPSSGTLVKIGEYVSTHKKVRTTLIIIVSVVILYLLNGFFYLSLLLSIIGGISPFLLIWIIWLLARRR